MQKYNIVINDLQREVLELAIGYVRERVPLADDHQEDEAELLQGMLKALPESEKDDPGIVHDFTL